MSRTTTPEASSLVDQLVDATPTSRDRYVDFLRAVSIAVVVCWHWVFSITQWRDGHLTMPNPVGDVPLLWTLTWFLQIMPLFFFVGGYANAASWSATRRNGEWGAGFGQRSLNRFYRPLAVFAVLWISFDVTLRALVPSYPGVLDYG